MPFSATCPECRTTFRAADNARGKKVRCSHCKSIFTADADDDPQPSAVTSVPAQTKTSRKPRLRDAEEEFDDRRGEVENQKSILPYVLIGFGVLVLLCGGGGTIAGIYIWKEDARIEQEKQQEAKRQEEEAKRQREEAAKRFQAEIEKAKADHEQRRKEMQQRFDEHRKRTDEEQKERRKKFDEHRKRMEEEHNERRKKIEANIEEQRKKIEERIKKNAPPNIPPQGGNP